MLAEAVTADFERSEITRAALSRHIAMPLLETLRRKMATGNLTVPELYLIAPLINGNPMSWVARVEAAVAEVRA